MKRICLRFPGFKDKAVTLSYDDGVRQDKRLIEIMDKYGLKGTFNLNGGLFSSAIDDPTKGRMTVDEAYELYANSNQEVAVHGFKHLSLASVDSACAVRDVIEDREKLESLFGRVIKGMAYANGSVDEKVVELLKQCGIWYARTTISTESFELADNWLRLPATCHHNNPNLMTLAKKFIEEEPSPSRWARTPKLFYLWGHSYEFDTNNNWNVIEEFAKYIGNREKVWYATNGEIYQYVRAFDRLEVSADGNTFFNPSSIDVYYDRYGEQVVIRAGETFSFDK